MRSNSTREAFDPNQGVQIHQWYVWRRRFSQSCLLATRLVESGVRLVSVQLGGWDTHRDNFARLKDTNLPSLDDGLAGLFRSLAAKGLLETTSVFVTGEFGRTPKINQRGGRDHYPRAMFCLLAGGGMPGGQVIGESDAKGEGPKDRVITPDDVAATFYHTLGIDHTKEYHTDWTAGYDCAGRHPNPGVGVIHGKKLPLGQAHRLAIFCLAIQPETWHQYSPFQQHERTGRHFRFWIPIHSGHCSSHSRVQSVLGHPPLQYTCLRDRGHESKGDHPFRRPLQCLFPQGSTA